MKTLDEEITSQKDVVDSVAMNLEYMINEQSNLEIVINRFTTKLQTERDHYNNLIVQRDMSKLREDAIEQLEGNN